MLQAIARHPRWLVIAPALTLALSIGSGGSDAHEIRFGALVIHHPWSRQSAATPGEAEGYMTITNTGKTDDRLVAVTGEIGPAAVIADAARNPLAGGLPIPAGATVVLKPHGLHVSFRDLPQPVEEGEEFTGTLSFARAGTVTVDYEVVAPGTGN